MASQETAGTGKRYCPVKRNVTRWSSTFAMLQRYLELKDWVDIEFNMIPDEEKRRIEALVDKMEPLEDITLKLQQEQDMDIDKATIIIRKAIIDNKLDA